MELLFVSRGKNTTISPIVQAQGESLKDQILVSYVTIEGKGIAGYIKSIFKIRSIIAKNHFDIIHAHYSLSGFSAAMSGHKAVVCSLMGSDIFANNVLLIITRLLAKYFWKATIVKSERMKSHLGFKNVNIIPNGINLEIFQPMNVQEAREKLRFAEDKKYILFLADPARPEKNYTLAEQACNIISKQQNVELMALHTIPHAEIPLYLSAADVLLLTSKHEGSPNVVKEAMACNCPVVSTDVGDVKEVINDTEGCYITNFDPEDVAEKLNLALDFGNQTNGREKIKHLDDKIIAEKIIKIYTQVIQNKSKTSAT
jgi:glycosyltransferase involved in cell wall biosynthesis